MSNTEIAIDGDQFILNGKPTYEGVSYNGLKIQGLLLNTRMVQGVFDDENPETRQRWAYPDTGLWDPERNTAEFLEAMPLWRAHNVLAFDLNLQGGSPEGYSQEQPWNSSAFSADGSLKPDYMARTRKILEKADELGMVVMLGLFYFGQERRLNDEAAVIRAVEETVDWLLAHDYRHVLLEISNECDVGRYVHPILQPPREHELIERAQSISAGGRRLLVSTSYRGRSLPSEKVVEQADYLLLHGNHEANPARIAHMVRMTRYVPAYSPKPILFNEDDHFDFDQPQNNLMAALGEYCSWGYFDPYGDGYQSPPVSWGLNTPRKKAFFSKIKEITQG